MHKTPHPVTLKRSLTLLVLATTVALALTAMASTYHPAKALAASCVFPTFHFYPGSPASHLRYGEANFHFGVCTNESGPSWSISASVSTNGTGESLGITFDSAQIYATYGGVNAMFYTGQFHYQTCVPYVGWPCRYSGYFYLHFNAATNQGPYVHYLGATIPSGLALFTTP